MTLKEMYNLQYDTSGHNYGLIIWYNELLDKTYDDLIALDVYRMFTQDVIKNLAISKAIEMLLINPYDGYFYDGEFLALLVSSASSIKKETNLSELKRTLQHVKQEYETFEWLDEESKRQYAINLDKMLGILSYRKATLEGV